MSEVTTSTAPVTDIAASTPADSTPSAEPTAAAKPKRKGLPDPNDYAEDKTPAKVTKKADKESQEDKKPEPKKETAPEPKKEVAEKKEPAPKKEEQAAKPEPKKESKEPEAKKPAPEQPAKKKLKVDGREIELSDDEVVRRAQMYTAADEKFKAAAEIEKKAKSIIEAIQTDPAAVLEHLGVDVDAMAEQRLTRKLQKELEPEKTELEELREWKRQQEQQAEQAKVTEAERVKKQQFEEAKQRAAKEYSDKIAGVLSESNLPRNPVTVKRVAELLAGAAQRGYPMDVETAASLVREQYVSDIQTLVGGLDGEALISMLGEGLVKKIRKYDLAVLKAKQAKQDPAGEPATIAETIKQEQSKPTRKSSGPKRLDDFLTNLAEKYTK